MTIGLSAAHAKGISSLPTVLLVEDTAVVRQSMRLLLESRSYAVIEAPTGEDAAALISNDISAAVLDIHLGGGQSGFDVLDALRRRPELVDIPVLMLTGGILTDAEEARIRRQHARVLYKPDGCNTFVSELDRLTGRNPARTGTGNAVLQAPAESIRKEFLAQTQRECWALQSRLTAGDEGDARQMVHRWIGAAGTLGYADLTRQAQQIQQLLEQPGTVTIDRVRAGVNTIARLCTELAQTPVGTNTGAGRVIEAAGGRLAGSTVVLAGFDDEDVIWIVRALDEAQAFSHVLGPEDARAGSRALERCDLLALAASSAAAGRVWRGAEAVARRLLLIGPAGTIAGWTRRLNRTTYDFLVTPCGGDELLLRADRLLGSGGACAPRPLDRPPGARRRVIIADDDPTIAALVNAAFQNYEFDCHIARDGGEALDLTRTLQPNALVLDVNMPRLSGFEVLDTLRNDPATAGVAVVLLSARQQEADVMRGFALGADDYIVKPFSPMELIARVKRLVRKSVA